MSERCHLYDPYWTRHAAWEQGYELLRDLGDAEYRTILQAWGALREQRKLGRDAHGAYLLQR